MSEIPDSYSREYSRDSLGTFICANVRCGHDEISHMLGTVHTKCANCDCDWFLVDFREINIAVEIKTKQLRKRNEVLEKVREFYADKSNYTEDSEVGYFSTTPVIVGLDELSEREDFVHDRGRIAQNAGVKSHKKGK